jgi:hypothetical protein
MIRCDGKEKGWRVQQSVKKNLEKRKSGGMVEPLRGPLGMMKKTYAGMHHAV